MLLLENGKSGGAHNAEIQPPRVVWRGDGGVRLVACMNFCLRDNLQATTLARDLASGSPPPCLLPSPLAPGHAKRETQNTGILIFRRPITNDTAPSGKFGRRPIAKLCLETNPSLRLRYDFHDAPRRLRHHIAHTCTDNHPLIPREIYDNAVQQTHLRTSHRTLESWTWRLKILDFLELRLTSGQRRRAPYNTRSQKVRIIKTPGGELRYLHIKKKGTAPKCGVS